LSSHIQWYSLCVPPANVNWKGLSSTHLPTVAAKILIVEDEIVIRKNLCAFLRKEGYEVTEARDGAQAIELLNSEHFDLMITDFAMPNLTGPELVEHVNALSPDIPIILLSGYLPSKSAKRDFAERVEFLEKPIALEDLLSAVERVLKRRHTAQR
jgi:DNA-binding NtrC family response regulator